MEDPYSVVKMNGKKMERLGIVMRVWLEGIAKSDSSLLSF